MPRPRMAAKERALAISVEVVDAKLAELRSWYPHAGMFCHFTELANLRAILQAGSLLSRNAAIAAGCLMTDTASPSVNSRAPAWVHDFARLYFAPRTPMLYDVEGVKRPGFKTDSPQCPRPVYLMFRPSVLTIEGARISTGNMASDESRWQHATEEWLALLPYRGIFHRGSIYTDYRDPEGSAYKSRIIQQRHAEVLVPGRISLDHLDRIVFRTEAERTVADRWCRCGPMLQALRVSVEPDLFNIGDGARVAVDRLQDNKVTICGRGLCGVTVKAWQGSGTEALECKENVCGASGWSGWSDWAPAETKTTVRFRGVIYTFDTCLKPMAVSPDFELCD